MAGSEVGSLYVIATPIGNLEDLSPRAARLLGEVDLLLCEDTRHTGALQRHLGVSTERWSLHAHNEGERIGAVLDKLAEGAQVGLCSDAGTPGLSDPGAKVVAAAQGAGFRVESVPGPFAAAVALAGAGLCSAPFAFWGFIAKRSSARRTQLVDRLLSAPGGGPMTHAFYVPGRDLRTFAADIAAVAPHARVAIARELTKIHESWLVGGASHLADELDDGALRGEAVVLVEVDRHSQAQAVAPVSPDELLRAAIAAGEGRKEALRRISRATGVARRVLYRRWDELGAGTG